MPFELLFSVHERSGQEDTLERLRTITQRGANNIGIEWSDPGKMIGISEHLYEILGIIGVLSIPGSMFASILANEVSRIVQGMQEPTKSDDKITFTLADTDRGKAMHIEFSSRDQVIVEAVAEKIRDFLV